MKPADVRSSTYFDSSKKLMIKILSLKLVILLEYQNIKIFLQKFMLQIDLKKFLWLKKLKRLGPGTYVTSDLNGEEIVGTFYVKELQKRIKKSWKKKKEKEKAINYVLNGKAMIILLKVGLIKKT